MNRDDVRYFLAVRAARSIKGAARALKVDHTTVSRRLAALEIALGVSLFERTPDGLVETEVGRSIAPIAERMEVHPAGKAPGEDSLMSRKVSKFGYTLFATQSYVDTHGHPDRPIRSLRGHDLVGNGHPLLMAWNTQLEEPAEVPLTVFPFISNLAAVVGGMGLGLIACVAGDQHPGLVRLSDVIGQWDLWLVTNPEARNNARVTAVKEALVELLEAAEARLSGGELEPPRE